MKILNVTMICKAVYSSCISVPDEMTFEDAIKYAKEHNEQICVGEMKWISDIEIDEENCNFDED